MLSRPDSLFSLEISELHPVPGTRMIQYSIPVVKIVRSFCMELVNRQINSQIMAALMSPRIRPTPPFFSEKPPGPLSSNWRLTRTVSVLQGSLWNPAPEFWPVNPYYLVGALFYQVLTKYHPVCCQWKQELPLIHGGDLPSPPVMPKTADSTEA